jgi:type II secretory pathway component PulL
MEKNNLAIDMGKDFIRAGVYPSAKLKSERFFGCEVAGSDYEGALKSVLADIAAGGYKGFSRVLLALPPALVSMRVVELPLKDAGKVEQILPFELSDAFLKRTEELQIAAVPLGAGRTMAVAVEKTVLNKYLDVLAAFGMDPEWVGTSLLSKDRLLTDTYDGPETAAFVDCASVSVVKNRAPYFFKFINDASDLNLCLATLAGEGVSIDRFYSTEKSSALITGLGKEVTPVFYADDETGLHALATRFQKGGDGAGNVRIGEFASTKRLEQARKGLKGSVLLLALLVALWAVHVYQVHGRLDNDMALVKDAMEAEYLELFPEETRVADAPYQLEIKLAELKQENSVIGRGVNTLDVMRRIAEGVKSSKVRLYQVHVSGEKVTAKGETDSFDGANRFKTDLEAMDFFSDITLTDVKSRAGGGVNFSVAAVPRGINDGGGQDEL